MSSRNTQGSFARAAAGRDEVERHSDGEVMASYQYTASRTRHEEAEATDLLTDDEIPVRKSSGKVSSVLRYLNNDTSSHGAIDDFSHGTGGFTNYSEKHREKALKTGRQRKKLAARSKGGEFQARRKKRRVYFCCISSDIDIQKLYDYLVGAGGLLNGWQYQLYPGGDVLHLYKPSRDDRETDPRSQSPDMRRMHSDIATTDHDMNQSRPFENALTLSAPGTQEVFVFDFGAAVFWGFSRGEETNLLKTFRMFVTKGYVEKEEFQSGEDDMAFSTLDVGDSGEQPEQFTLTNDFIQLPDNSPVKQRLSISFAIAQSSVLAIFESRIERKIEEYKYIPETLAAYGKVHLSERQLGIMIGEVFVIRHDVNLHTEILDTPAFFWKEERFEANYKLVMDYLEMSGRTEILNKRTDMLRELLEVLQHQMENEHGVKLEWIVIWLIVAEVAVQLFTAVYG